MFERLITLPLLPPSLCNQWDIFRPLRFAKKKKKKKKRFLEKSQLNLGFNTVSTEQRGDLRITEESHIKPGDFSQANVIFFWGGWGGISVILGAEKKPKRGPNSTYCSREPEMTRMETASNMRIVQVKRSTLNMGSMKGFTHTIDVSAAHTCNNGALSLLCSVLLRYGYPRNEPLRAAASLCLHTERLPQKKGQS